MKKKISDHLKNLFPLEGVDYEHLEKIGYRNIQAMINSLGESDNDYYDKIEKWENKFEECSNDIMEATEIASYIAYLRIKIGNRKITRIALTDLLSRVRQEPSAVFPTLPELRDTNHFKTGDEVYVYVGKTGIDSNDKEDNRGKHLSNFNWVYGRVLKLAALENSTLVHVFLINRFYKKSPLDGHYTAELKTSPMILKTDEFFSTRNTFRVSEYSDFKEIFLKNCSYMGMYFNNVFKRNDYDQVEKIIMDPNCEEITTEQLQNSFLTAVEITAKQHLFSQQARLIAERAGIKI